MSDQVHLQVINLSRSFGEFQALKPLSFDLYPGEIAILSGSNGAGKSTLLYCLSGLLRPTTGTVGIDGYDLYQQEVAAKQRLAFVPDVPRFYPELTCWEHVYFISAAFRVEAGWEERAETLFKQFELWENRDTFPYKLSRGMRLKMGILLALIRPFKVLLMDEPTSALDPAGVDLLIDKLLVHRDSGSAILLTSHDSRIAQGLKGKLWQMEQGSLKVE